ncbi:hypothetical protein PQC07_gp240 [Aeromonas phage D3]|uniref:Uncharacterized protein n=2 Tax=Ludhianavirus TaxID=3044751 RepID=A0A7D6F5G1_9CAUD|nr:hypothetical protein PQC07_gp240 [Aeromonas phage D3]YP_010668784.1 hypothetical protein PQC08_gp239 [Aeromonas phage D6]QLM02894.1 hypothetical protein D3_0035 [Aeromonas phage D3]QNH80840.1 hypothetical protein D6_0036 [Aeromonas phage D6]
MRIIFNLSRYTEELRTTNRSPEGFAFGALQQAIRDMGIPLPPASFVIASDDQHLFYNEICGIVERELISLPTPRHANLVMISPMFFQLELL